MNKNEVANKIYEILQLYNSFNNSRLMPQIKIKKFSFHKATDNPSDINKAQPIEKTTEIPIKIKQSSLSNLNINQKRDKLFNLTENIFQCNLCTNQQIKNKRIPGVGNIDANVIIVLPPQINKQQFNEKPLSSEAELFLEKWLNAIDLSTKKLFLTNITKCYLRNVTKQNITNCLPFFDLQLEILNPQIMLILGQISISSLQKKHADLNLFHGKLLYYQNIPYIATYDPEFVMANQSLKKVVWEDLKIFKKLINQLSNNSNV